MKESDLYLPMKQWFAEQGYRVRPEIFVLGRCYDAVAVKEQIVVGIEMKLSLTKGLLDQIRHADLFADYAYVVIATKPREESEVLGRCLGLGIGILSYKQHVIKEIYTPIKAKSSVIIERYHDEVLKLADMLGDSEDIGGVPQMKGVGPAQTVRRLIDDYRQEHPEATWKTLYQQIPNHYSNYRSMQGAMCMLQQRLAIQELDKRRWERIRSGGVPIV